MTPGVPQMGHRLLLPEPGQMDSIRLRGQGWWLVALDFGAGGMDKWEPLQALEHGSDLRK